MENSSDFKEPFANCELKELVNKFKLCLDKVCINGSNNNFIDEVNSEFTVKIEVQKSNVFRIVNTIIAISLRQIKNGFINLYIQLMS